MLGCARRSADGSGRRLIESEILVQFSHQRAGMDGKEAPSDRSDKAGHSRDDLLALIPEDVDHPPERRSSDNCVTHLTDRLEEAPGPGEDEVAGSDGPVARLPDLPAWQDLHRTRHADDR